MSDVVYLYGFVPADAPAPDAGLTGLAEGPVELLPLGEVQAVIGRLPAEQYGADQIAARLEDMGWVSGHGVAHERVVLWYVDRSEILPARLFTLYSGAAALEHAVLSELPRIAQQLRALTGRREWNLKVAFDRGELARHGADVSAEVREMDAAIAAAPPGRRYLMERRRGELLKRELGSAARRLADELLAALAEGAEDVRVLPLAASDAGGTVVLNAALLLRTETDADWRERADALIDRQRELGMIVTLSGPWAPYRFLEADADA